MKKFKDCCDQCGKFDFCTGKDGFIVCQSCLKNYKPVEKTRNKRSNNKKIRKTKIYTQEKQMNIYDFLDYGDRGTIV